MSEPKKLTQEQYNKFLYRMEKMMHQKTKDAYAVSRIEVAQKDAAIKSLEHQFLRSKLDSVKEDTVRAEEDYAIFLEDLSVLVGCPIKDCAINPITLEITKL